MSDLASTADDAVSFLPIEEPYKYRPGSGAAALSCPMGHLDVTCLGWNADFVAKNCTRFRCAIGRSFLLVLWHLEHSQIPSPGVLLYVVQLSLILFDPPILLFHNICDSFVDFLQRLHFRLKFFCLHFNIKLPPLQLLNFLHESLGQAFYFIPHLLYICFGCQGVLTSADVV